jgi:broad specificity phosphatase PhoE
MIYFIRHGQCEANLQDVFAGQRNDSPLTDEGRAQAKAAGEHVKELGLSIDRMICSPMSRTKDTAAIVASVIGFDPANFEYDRRIVEYDMGELSGKPHKHLTSADVIAAPGAENPVDFQTRVLDALKEFDAYDGTVLLVSHAGVGRVIEGTRQGLEPKEFYNIAPYKNGCVTLLDLNFLKK